MLKKVSVFIIIGLLNLHASFLLAQVPTRLECGNNIQSAFTEDGTHEYTINLLRGTKILLYGETIVGNYENLAIDIGLTAPNDVVINRLHGDDRRSTTWVESLPISNEGEYSVRVAGWTSTGASYVLYVSCVDEAGNVISSNNLVQKIECGTIVDNEFRYDGETHMYFGYVHIGDKLTVNVTALPGNYEDLALDAGLTGPEDYNINRLHGDDRRDTQTIETLEFSRNGVFRLPVAGWTGTGAAYNLTLTCVLADGSVINPGDTPPKSLEPSVNDQNQPGVLLVNPSEFSGYGFPGLGPVNFAEGVTTALTGDLPSSGSISPGFEGIFGFTFEGNQNDRMQISFTRKSGNLNLGLAVVSSDGVLAFQTSLLTTDSLTADFTLPTNGSYTIGIFPIDLTPPSNPEATTFEVAVTLNP